jgi:ATP-binding cassette subfamily B protein
VPDATTSPALTYLPGDTMRARAALRWHLAARVLGYLRPYRRQAALAVVCAVLEAALALIPIIALKVLIDRLTGSDPAFGDIVPPVVAACGAIISVALLGVASTYLSQSISEGVVYDMRQQLFGHLIGQGTDFYTARRGGDVLSRIINDVAVVSAALPETLVAGIGTSLAAGTTITLMLVLDWRLALVALALSLLVIVPTRRAGQRIGTARTAVQEQLSSMTAYLSETLGLSGMLLVRAFGRHAAERERFTALNAELRRRQVTTAMTASWFVAGLKVVGSVAPVLVLLCGGYLVTQGLASLGTVLVFSTVIMSRLGSAVQGLATTGATAIGSLAVWRRIFETLDTHPNVVERPGAHVLERPSGAIRLEGVTFAYAGQERPAVCDVDLTVEPGQLVALVGPSGAGKSTLSALVARLIDPDEGRVLLDGHDARDLTVQSVSDTIGIVFQDTFLFHASMEENLRYGRPDASDADLADAIRDAHLDEVVACLPEGLATTVGERGHHLSGGEKQRVALARAMLKDPKILILDEATSHLDSVSEAAVQDGLQRLLPGRTSLVIAHRLSTIQRADLVLVMDTGRVVERGTHDELVARGGVYARMYELQIEFGAPARG